MLKLQRFITLTNFVYTEGISHKTTLENKMFPIQFILNQSLNCLVINREYELKIVITPTQLKRKLTQYLIWSIVIAFLIPLYYNSKRITVHIALVLRYVGRYIERDYWIIILGR